MIEKGVELSLQYPIYFAIVMVFVLLSACGWLIKWTLQQTSEREDRLMKIHDEREKEFIQNQEKMAHAITMLSNSIDKLADKIEDMNIRIARLEGMRDEHD